MDFPKLLIAVERDEFRQALREAVKGHYEVRACGSGGQALALLRDFRPDLLVTDLMLPELDGLTLLQLAIEAGIRPKTLVIASDFSPYALAALVRLGVDYPMRSPSIQAVTCRLADLAAELRAPSTVDSAPIAHALLRLGLNAHLDGFAYLLTAIPFFAGDPEQSITKELYVAVAAVHGKDARQIERSIRSAIYGAWKRRSDPTWAVFFAPGADGGVARPTNGRFISQMAHLLLRRPNAQRTH